MELRALIEASPESTREALAQVLDVRADPRSRLGPVELLLRAWFQRPTHEARFSEEERLVLRLMLSEHTGVEPQELPPAAEALLAQAWLLRGSGQRVYMPDALRLCLGPTPSDPPHAARLLLMRLEHENARSLSQAHYRRPVQGPLHAMLERPLRRLLDPSWIHESLEAQEAPARRLLDAAVERAGELAPDDILELEREPTRIRVAGAAVVPKRSYAYVLARQGLLLPQPSGQWLLPEEVWEVLTAEARSARAAELARLRARDDEDEPLPAKVQRALSPSACAATLLAVLHERGALREGVGVAKASLERTARELGVPLRAAPVLASVGRAAGLPFGHLRLHEVGPKLWRTWRATSAYDEMADDPDGFRMRPRREAAQAVLRAVREAVLETLAGLPPHRFATRAEVVGAATASARVGEAREAVVEHIVDVSLPALGYVDVGVAEGETVLRATAAARAFYEGRALPMSELGREPLLRVDAPMALDGNTPVAVLCALARTGRMWVDADRVYWEVDGVELGLEATERGWPAVVRELSPALPLETDAQQQSLKSAAVQGGAVTWRSVQAALHVPDRELRRRLLRDPEGVEVWLELDEDAEYLLVRSSVTQRRVRRLLRKYGVVLEG